MVHRPSGHDIPKLTSLNLLLTIELPGALGYWPSFLNLSARYREAFKGTLIGRAAQLDSPTLDAYSLWRGFVVPGFLSMSTYTV